MSALQHRRRWFQISLRTLMLLVTVSCLGFGWFSYRWRKAERQRAAVKALLDTRSMAYDYQLNPKGGSQREAQPPGPDGLRRLLGVDFFADLVYVDLRPSDSSDVRSFTDADLVHLQGLGQLKTLSIRGKHVSDVGIANLRGLTRLKALMLYDTSVTDAGLAHLAGLTQLEVLSLFNAQVTDAGLVHLRRLSQLEDLYLNGTRVTDAGLVHFHGLTQLKILNLNGTQVTESGYSELEKVLPNLAIHR
jgi:hypothetical protein